MNSLLSYHFVCMEDSWAGWQSHQTIKIEERQWYSKSFVSTNDFHVKLIFCVAEQVTFKIFWNCRFDVINSYLLLSFITYVLTIPGFGFPFISFYFAKVSWSTPQIPSTNSMIVPTWSLNIFILLIHRIRPILPANNWNSWSQKKIATVFSLKHETSTERNDLFLKFDIDVRLDYYRNLSISVIKSFKSV